MRLEVTREMTGVLVVENRRRFLDVTAILQERNRLPLAVFRKPDVRAFAHLFVKISFQRPHRHFTILRQQRGRQMPAPIQPLQQAGTHCEMSAQYWGRNFAEGQRFQSC